MAMVMLTPTITIMTTPIDSAIAVTITITLPKTRRAASGSTTISTMIPIGFVDNASPWAPAAPRAPAVRRILPVNC
jgi:hypothetical protein